MCEGSDIGGGGSDLESVHCGLASAICMTPAKNVLVRCAVLPLALKRPDVKARGIAPGTQKRRCQKLGGGSGRSPRFFLAMDGIEDVM